MPRATPVASRRSRPRASGARIWSFAYSRRLFATMGRLADVLAPQAPRLARTRPGPGARLRVAHRAPRSGSTRSRRSATFAPSGLAQPALRAIVAAATQFSGRDVAADIPVAVAWAPRDTVFPAQPGSACIALLPDAEHVLLRGCGHVPMTDAPDRVAELILRAAREQLRDSPRGRWWILRELTRRRPVARARGAASDRASGAEYDGVTKLQSNRG